MSANKIKDISSVTHQKFPNLKIAHFSNCQIEKVGSLNLPNLENINLSQNRIKDISFFQKTLALSQLKSIYVCDCHIESINYQMFPPQIRALNLSSNKICSISALKKLNFPCLQKLDIFNNKLLFLPDLSFEKVEQVSMSGNQFNDISSVYKWKMGEKVKGYSFGNLFLIW